MATAAAMRKGAGVQEINFNWTGKDKAGKTVRGEMRASGEAQVNAMLRRQGIKVDSIKKQRAGRGGSVSDKDVTLFTRQLATMMKSGVPLLQAFDIVGKGHANPAVATWSAPANKPVFWIACSTASRRTRKKSLPSRARSSPRCSIRCRLSWSPSSLPRSL